MKHYQMWLTWLLLGAIGVLLLTSVAYASCTVSTTSINFGSYDFLSSAADTGTGYITLSCSPQANVTIAIGASLNSGGFYPRMMQHDVSDDTLDYNIYTSAAMMQVWGDGTHGTVTVYSGNVKKSNSPILVYGKIVPLQNVPAGSYSEPLIVTITY